MAASDIDMKAIAAAARAIHGADAILVATGAGMGVGSGLGTFRGKAAGVWPPLQKYGIDFTEMSCPDWFFKPTGNHKDSVNFAFGFWKYRYDAYTSASPHRGYHLLKAWADKKAEAKGHGGFAFTSNIDGQMLEAGFSADRVMECHGSVRWMQCSHPAKGISGKCDAEVHPTWGFAEMEVDEETYCAKGELPRCPHCRKLARPAVLMFGDWHYLPTKHDEQEEAYNKWLAGLVRSKARLAIIEIGAGVAVPTVRMESERRARQFKAPLIRINPEHSHMPADLQSSGVSFASDAVRVLELIDAEIAALEGRPSGTASATATEATTAPSEPVAADAKAA